MRFRIFLRLFFILIELFCRFLNKLEIIFFIVRILLGFNCFFLEFLNMRFNILIYCLVEIIFLVFKCLNN